jgi:hypothetical protein
MISSELVDRACVEVDGYNEDRMMSEFNTFFQEQPSICDFVTELTSESSLKIQELSLFLSYMVFKTVKMGQTDSLGTITSQSIEAAYRESENWIERINQDGDEAQIPPEPEPHLVQYVISELNQPLEDGKVLEDEEKGEVFFVLKTVISSLTRSSLGQNI